MLRVMTALAEVFPAYAGVFPDETGTIEGYASLPRIRGGVSAVLVLGVKARGSSPHTRGCFPLPQPAGGCRGVFPAYAGVFLAPGHF